MLLCASGLNARGTPQERATGTQREHRKQPAACDRVIQGRIIAMEGDIFTVKTPDAYPGREEGVHAQVVVAGPKFKVDISRARILLPDGRESDERPLAVGDSVLMLLSDANQGPPGPRGPLSDTQVFHASTIERLVASDKIITH